MTLIKKFIIKSLKVCSMGPLTVLISQKKMVLKQQYFHMTKTILIDRVKKIITQENSIPHLQKTVLGTNGLNHFFKDNQKCPQG